MPLSFALAIATKSSKSAATAIVSLSLHALMSLAFCHRCRDCSVLSCRHNAHRTGVALPPQQCALYGRQLLEGLAFLRTLVRGLRPTAMSHAPARSSTAPPVRRACRACCASGPSRCALARQNKGKHKLLLALKGRQPASACPGLPQPARSLGLTSIVSPLSPETRPDDEAGRAPQQCQRACCTSRAEPGRAPLTPARQPCAR